MLVLTRRQDEDLILHSECGEILAKIRVADISCGQVKLGIDAPDMVKINRREIYEKIMDKKKEK